jgi:HEAT repeat protein
VTAPERPLPPQHARLLAQRLRDGQLALFVGAGLSHLAPAADGSGERLPLWKDLTRRVGEVCGEDPAEYQNDPLDLFDAVVFGQERATLERAVRAALDDRPFELSAAHRALKALPWAAVLSTNYDGLLARLYGEAPVWDEEGYDRVRLSGAERPLLFQIHGTLERPHTLTREDYRLWEEKHPRALHHLTNILLNGTALFVGYSLSDPHLDALLATVRKITAGREKRLFAWMWQLPEGKARLLDRRDKIEAVSIATEEDWARAFEQVAEALRELAAANVATAASAPPVAADPYAYERAQYVQALEARYGAANLQGLYIWGAGYARGDVTLEEIFVEPDLVHAEREEKAGARERFTLRGALQAEEADKEASRPSTRREPASRVHQREPKLVVVAAPGQGKSTLLRRWLLDAARRWQQRPEAEPLPVYVRLAEWEARAQDEAGLLARIVASLPQLGEIGSDAVRAWTSQPILWLLDGLDEVRDPYERERLREEIVATAALRPHDRWAIAMRPAAEPAGGFAAGWRRAELPALSDPQLLQVLQRWAGVLQRKEGLRLDARAIHRDLRRDRGLGRLKGNALLVTLAVLFYKSHHRLPHDRWEFYEAAEKVLRDTWVNHRLRGAEHHLPGNYLAELLERLALHGMVQGEVLFTRRDLERECRDLLAQRGYGGADCDREAARFVRAAEDLIGVFVAQGPDTFGFLHLTFQEFLASRALRNRSGEVPGMIRRFWDHPDWREVWLLYALSVQADPARLAGLFQEILAHPRPLDRHLQRHRLACLRLCGVLPGALTAHGEEILRWAVGVLDGKPNAVFQKVLGTLGGWERSTLGPPFAAALRLFRDGEGGVSAAAAEALTPVAREKEVKEALLARLGDPDDQIRWTIGNALSAAAGDSELQSALLMRLGDEDEEVREAAARALRGAVSEPAVREALLARLGDQSLSVQWAVADALSSVVREPEVREAFLAQLDGGHSRVPGFVDSALSSIAHEPEVRRALLERLGDEHPSVRSAAAAALFSVAGEPEVREALLARLHDKDPYMRLQVAQAVASSGAEPAALAALLKLLGDKLWPVRDEAATALSARPETRVRKALLRRLRDETSYVRRAATEALASSAAEPAVRSGLLARLGDDAWNVRWSAVRALSSSPGAPEVCKALLAWLGDEDAGVRSAAARALSAAAGEPKVREALLALLDQDDDWDVQGSAYDALAASAAESSRQPSA